MSDIQTERNPPLSERNVRAFEKKYGIILPNEYRQFLRREADGGAFGPRCGLLPLGMVPSPWTEVHDYSIRLSQPFPLDEEWIWEDEPEASDLEERIEAADNGVLLLGEDGCGARWVLVVTGRRAGEVWLSTGEGTTPTGHTFESWLKRFEVDGPTWWYDLVESWGPSPNIWFEFHAAKQLYLKQQGKAFATIAQTTPLCLDCIQFLSQACEYAQSDLAVSTPTHVWNFSKDGTVAASIKHERFSK